MRWACSSKSVLQGAWREIKHGGYSNNDHDHDEHHDDNKRASLSIVEEFVFDLRLGFRLLFLAVVDMSCSGAIFWHGFRRLRLLLLLLLLSFFLSLLAVVAVSLTGLASLPSGACACVCVFICV